MTQTIAQVNQLVEEVQRAIWNMDFDDLAAFDERQFSQYMAERFGGDQDEIATLARQLIHQMMEV